jgi:hypothetical protein
MEEYFDLHHERKLEYLADEAHQHAQKSGRPGHTGYYADKCPQCIKTRNEVEAESNLSKKQFGK